VEGKARGRGQYKIYGSCEAIVECRSIKVIPDEGEELFETKIAYSQNKM